MRPDRNYSQYQRRFQDQVIPLNLACSQVLEELVVVQKKGVFPEYPSSLHLLRDSFYFYSNPSSYKGSTEKRDLLFQTHSERYVLKEIFKGGDKARTREIYSHIKLLLDRDNLPPALRIKTSKKLIGEITHLLECGLALVNSPPPDLPAEIVQFAMKFA